LGADANGRGRRAGHQEQAEGATQPARTSRCISTVTTNATCSAARALTRREFHWTDDGNFAGLRYDQYKAVFMEQPAHGLEVWMQPFVPLRAPKLFNLRSDPFERAEHEAGGYDRWFIEHVFVLVPAQAIVGQFLATFQEFPPRQKPGSFSVNQALQKMMTQKGSN
jgi:arylsulfatase